jgi:hypothetical protein
MFGSETKSPFPTWQHEKLFKEIYNALKCISVKSRQIHNL